MTQTSGGPTIDQNGTSEPTKGQRDREPAGTAGNAAEKDEKPANGGRDRGETSSAGDGSATGLDTAHDRAS